MCNPTQQTYPHPDTAPLPHTPEQIRLIKEKLEEEKKIEAKCQYGLYLKLQEDYMR